MVVKSLKYFFILFSCTRLRDWLLIWYYDPVFTCIAVLLVLWHLTCYLHHITWHSCNLDTVKRCVKLRITPHTWWGTSGVPTSCPRFTCYRHYYWLDSLFLLPGTHMMCGSKCHMELISHHTRDRGISRVCGGTSAVPHRILGILVIQTQYMAHYLI